MIAWIVSSSVLIGVVVGVRFLFRGKINPRMQYALWLLVLLRLLLPVSIGQSAASVMNYVPEREPVRWEDVQDRAARSPQSPVQPAAVKPAAEPWQGTPAADERPVTEIAGESGTSAEPILQESPDYTALLKTVWLAGAGVVLLGILASNLRFALRLRRSRRLLERYQGLPVYECLWLETPCLFGLFRPAVYLCGGVEEGQRDYVLRHEYSHYRQGDHLWALLRGVCLALHWYNPLVWLAARLSKRDGELACDEQVTRHLGGRERIEYGQTLIRLSCSRPEPVFCTATTMSCKGRALKERIDYIARRPHMLLSTMLIVLLAAALAVGCTFTGASGEAAPSGPVPSPEPTAAAPATAAPSVSPLPSATPDALSGRLLDRSGLPIDLRLYPGLAGAEESFAEYLSQGMDVYLTIKLPLQEKAQEVMAQVLGNVGGAVVAVDVNTGEPLAIASNGSGENRALQGCYQPENLFLPCTAIAALSENLVDADYEIRCEGLYDRYEAEGFAPTCWIWNAVEGEHYVHGEETMTDALRDSCYYYFYAVGSDLGIEKLRQYAAALGLGQPTGIELPESIGSLDGPRIDPESGELRQKMEDTLEAAAGRGDNAFTPLQLAEYCAAIANNGLRYSASILSAVSTPDGETLYTRQPQLAINGQDKEQQALSRILEDWQRQPYIWDAIHQGMDSAQNDMSHNSANAAIWGESEWNTAGISHMGVGLFMGYAPYEDPQVAICVVVDSEEREDCAMVGEIARRILDAYEK